MFVRVILGADWDIAHETVTWQDDTGVLILHALSQDIAVSEELVIGTVAEVLLLRTHTTEHRSDSYLRDVIRTRHVLL